MAGLTEAQEAALRHLVADGVLSAEQGEAVRTALAAAAPARRSGVTGWLVELAGYVGGGLMLGGAALFLGTSWDHLTRPVRVVVLMAIALAFAVAGIAVAGGPLAVRALQDGPAVRRRVVAVLFALATVPAALAAGVATDRYAGLVGGAVGLAVALAGLAALNAPPGIVAAAASSVVAVVELGDELLHLRSVGMAVLLIGLGLAWTAATVSGPVHPRWLGLAVGTGLALVGAQQPIGDDGRAPVAYALTVAVAIGCFVLYHWQRLLVVLAAGVIGVTLAVPEAVSDVTNGALGGAAILLLAGAVLVAASAVGLRLRGRYRDAGGSAR